MRLVFENDGSRKFWEISVKGSSHTVRFGKLGTEGQVKTKTFSSASAATQDAEKLIRAKTSKGYVVDPGGSAKATTKAKGTLAKAPARKKAEPATGQRTVGKHVPPAILQRFATWFEGQPFRSLGIERLAFEQIYRSWDPELTPRLRRDGYVLFHLGEGSMIVPLQVGDATPVLKLDSDGGPSLLASSLEEFLVRWSEGKTGMWEVDGLPSDGYVGITGAGRKALKSWLQAEGVKTPKRTAFDLDRYLEGDAPATPPPSPSKLPPSARLKGLPKQLDELVDLIGRRADDPVVQAFVKNVMKKQVPQSTTFYEPHASVEAERLGFEISLSHDCRPRKVYPPIVKTSRSYIPYVSRIFLNALWTEKLPFSLSRDATSEAVTRSLGAPRRQRDPYWTKLIDPSRQVELYVTTIRDGIRIAFGLPL